MVDRKLVGPFSAHLGAECRVGRELGEVVGWEYKRRVGNGGWEGEDEKKYAGSGAWVKMALSLDALD